MTKLYLKPVFINGFSLIELLIAVAIVAILAAIAYPSYQEQIRKSRRADAKSVLLQGAQWMERFYTENNCYSKTRLINGDGTVTICGGTAVVLPFTKSPIDGGTQYYDISLAAVAQNTFTLNAAPTSGTDQTKDKCQTLTLTNTGLKDVTGGATLTKEECWR